MRRSAFALLLVLATIVTSSAPLTAQESPPAPGDVQPRLLTPEELQAAQAIPKGLAEDTLRYLFLEIAILSHLDAFTGESRLDFTMVHDQYGPWPDPDRQKLLAVLDAVDAELATRANGFRLVPDATNPLLNFVVKPLPDQWRSGLSAGQTRFIQGFEYRGAVDTLIARQVDFNADTFGPGSEFDDPFLELSFALDLALERLADAESLNQILGAEIANLEREVAALSEGPRSGLNRSSPTSWTTLIVAGGGGLLIVLLLGIVLTTRRAAGRRAEDPATAAAIEAHRLLNNARTESDVAAITADIGASLTGAQGAAVLRRTPEGLRPAGQPAVLIGSSLNRVVDAGQPLATSLSNDPLLPGIDAQVIGVPVAHNGTIIGVLAAWNVGERPLEKSTRSHLELISPVIGGALTRADERGTMEKLAMVDGLTSLGNRRRLDGDLESTLAAAVASDLPVGFAMIDVDHFKTYNDTHGHTAGDVALQEVAATIADCVRDSDVVYRYGGEEFSILLPGSTPEEAMAVAERVRAAVEALTVPGEQLQPAGKLTVSIGVATLESGSASDIKERADAALYRAKSGGRNTVVID